MRDLRERESVCDTMGDTVEELRTSLKDYEAQLASVRELLEAEPTNEEYVELEKTLKEVVDMNADLLRDAEQGEEEEKEKVMNTATRLGTTSAAAEVGMSEHVPVPLPVAGRRSHWQPGEMCEAKYSDGKWHKARIVDVRGAVNGSDTLTYVVHYSDYGNSEEVRSDCVRDPVIVKVRMHAHIATSRRTSSLCVVPFRENS